MAVKILKFNINGKFAFFKNPQANSVYYFTFNNIHRVALLGILGSVLGLKGYNQQAKDEEYPEFYEKLKDLEVAIVPQSDVCPVKKIQTFNNSTLFFNKGADKHGANLIVREEWIENPSWDIYVKLDEENELHKELLERFTDRNFEYVPYFGKNDHFANIVDIEVFNLEDIEITTETSFKIDSFYIKGQYEEYSEGFFKLDSLIYRESLPYALLEATNHYEYKTLEYSTTKVKPISSQIPTYKIKENYITFI